MMVRRPEVRNRNFYHLVECRPLLMARPHLFACGPIQTARPHVGEPRTKNRETPGTTREQSRKKRGFTLGKPMKPPVRFDSEWFPPIETEPRPARFRTTSSDGSGSYRFRFPPVPVPVRFRVRFRRFRFRPPVPPVPAEPFGFPGSRFDSHASCTG